MSANLNSKLDACYLAYLPSAQQFRDLRERNIDLLFGRILPQIEEDVHSEVLFHDRLVIAAGPRSKWTRQRKIVLSDLVDAPWVLPRRDTILGALVADAFRAKGMKFPPKGAVEGASSLICALLARGPFLGTVPVSLLRFGASIPGLKVLPVNLSVAPWETGIMTLKNRTVTPVVSLFIDCVREIVKPLANKS